MSRLDRSHSILQMTSPLGEDVLVPTAIAGHEAISQPFSFRVQMVSENGDISPDDLLHQPGCVKLRRGDADARCFHGIFQEFAAAGQARPGIYAYSATLVPRFWFLAQTIDCRIFQDKTATQIIEQMLDDAGVEDYEFRLYQQPPPRHYTVQFNETDLHFATRLMEESGLFYFFEHDEDSHTLVIADSNDAFQDMDDANLRFDSQITGEDVLTAWHRPRATTHGQVKLKDYDPSAPGKQLQATQTGDQDVAGSQQRDVFVWPAATHKPGVVDNRAQIMIDAAVCSVSLCTGAGRFRPMAAGQRFTLEQDPLSGEQDARYVVRWLSFDAVDESWSTEGRSAYYANSFECFETSVNWRQPISMTRPEMGGVHSAIVLGPEGEEIHTDELGRVKVQFFWDYRQEGTASQSTWARVVQPWAGNGWGGQFIPRVGTEVAVAFIDGIADRPVVLGGLYNGDQKPIYAVTDKTKGGLRTRSSPQGGASEFNELTFEDRKGQEQVFIQAQKDLHTKVKHDQSLAVGNDRTVQVGNAESVTIGNGRTTEISKADDRLTVKQGDLSIEISQGKAAITAMQSIELTVGASRITIDQTGITISGPQVTISADAAASLSGGNVKIKGGTVEIN